MSEHYRCQLRIDALEGEVKALNETRQKLWDALEVAQMSKCQECVHLKGYVKVVEAGAAKLRATLDVAVAGLETLNYHSISCIEMAVGRCICHNDIAGEARARVEELLK